MKVCLACGRRFEADDWHCPGCGRTPKRQGGYLSFSPDLADAKDGFEAEYFPQLAQVEAKNFWFRSRNRLIIWALRHYFPQASSFLEIGCGTGYVLSGIRREFPNMALLGSEIFSEGLVFAEKRLPGVALLQMDAHHVPFESEFDVIGAFDLLEHIEDDEAVIRQMRQAVKPGGGIVLTVPQHPFLWSFMDDYAFHRRRYTREDLVGKVERAGLDIVRATSFVSILLPLMLLSRLKRRRSKDDFDLVAQLSINPVLNAALEKALEVIDGEVKKAT